MHKNDQVWYIKFWSNARVILFNESGLPLSQTFDNLLDLLKITWSDRIKWLVKCNRIVINKTQPNSNWQHCTPSKLFLEKDKANQNIDLCDCVIRECLTDLEPLEIFQVQVWGVYVLHIRVELDLKFQTIKMQTEVSDVFLVYSVRLYQKAWIY